MRSWKQRNHKEHRTFYSLCIERYRVLPNGVVWAVVDGRRREWGEVNNTARARSLLSPVSLSDKTNTANQPGDEPADLDIFLSLTCFVLETYYLKMAVILLIHKVIENDNKVDLKTTLLVKSRTNRHVLFLHFAT